MQKAPSGAPVFAIPRWKWHNRNPWNSKQLVAQQRFSKMDAQVCIIFLDSTLQKEVVKKRIHWPLGQKFTIMHSQQSPSHQSPSLPRSCKHIHSPLVLFPLQKATISVQTFWINVPHLMLRLLIKNITYFWVLFHVVWCRLSRLESRKQETCAKRLQWRIFLPAKVSVGG